MKIKFRDFIFEHTDILISFYKKHGNHKPAVIFDKKHGTSLSQTYNYPNNLSENEVWNIIIEYLSQRHTKNINDFDKLIDILNKLNKYFFYVDMKDLSIDDKFNILYGMVSGFNSDDIIWFSVDHNTGMRNKYVNKEISKLPHNIRQNIGWVLSPKTLKKLKEQLHIPPVKDEEDFEWWD